MQHHVLRASRFLRDNFDTLSGRGVESEGSGFLVDEGWPARRHVKVLFEELFYNDKYKPFRVLCIERPFDGGTESGPAVEDSECDAFLAVENSADALKLLLKWPDNAPALEVAQRACDEFNKCYVLVRGFIQHAADKVNGIVEQTTLQLMDENSRYATGRVNRRHMFYLQNAVSC